MFKSLIKIDKNVRKSSKTFKPSRHKFVVTGTNAMKIWLSLGGWVRQGSHGVKVI